MLGGLGAGQRLLRHVGSQVGSDLTSSVGAARWLAYQPCEGPVEGSYWLRCLLVAGALGR